MYTCSVYSARCKMQVRWARIAQGRQDAFLREKKVSQVQVRYAQVVKRECQSLGMGASHSRCTMRKAVTRRGLAASAGWARWKNRRFQKITTDASVFREKIGLLVCIFSAKATSYNKFAGGAKLREIIDTTRKQSQNKARCYRINVEKLRKTIPWWTRVIGPCPHMMSILTNQGICPPNSTSGCWLQAASASNHSLFLKGIPLVVKVYQKLISEKRLAQRLAFKKGTEEKPPVLS